MAKQIAEEEVFDDFVILTLDKDLRSALNKSDYGISKFVANQIPYSDIGLTPLSIPTIN
jgi:hypothetical protein